MNRQTTLRLVALSTLKVMKVGLTQSAAEAYTGQVHVCDIGVPRGLITEPRP